MKVNTLIKQLQDYQIMYGNVDVTMCVRGIADPTEIKDILADEEGITLYDWV